MHIIYWCILGKNFQLLQERKQQSTAFFCRLSCIPKIDNNFGIGAQNYNARDAKDLNLAENPARTS